MEAMIEGCCVLLNQKFGIKSEAVREVVYQNIEKMSEKIQAVNITQVFRYSVRYAVVAAEWFSVLFVIFVAVLLIIKDYDEDKIKTLMQNKAIVRNKRKIEAAKINANVFIQIQKEFGSFDAYLWHFTDNKVVYDHDEPIPTSTPLSDEISNDLKKRGMKFVGTTIIYAYLQAIGVVNSHEKDCFLYQKH